MDRIPLPVHHGIDFVAVQDVLYLKADGNYSVLICINKILKHTTRSLKDFEVQLENSEFCRIHHEYLVNMIHVSRYIKGDGGEIELSNGERLPVSRGRKSNLKKYL